MFKKALISFFVMVLLVTGSAAAAIAETVSEEVQAGLAEVEKANAKIDEEISKAVYEAEVAYAKYQEKLAAESAQDKKDSLTESFHAEVDALYIKLDAKTREITAAGVEKAQAAGIEVEVYYISVTLADREFMIDPIRVIGW